ncbi:hypothetical protein [Alteromonas gracilis]|uniref:hypothetical protein n=1 Tax=Alteromonas gracilis TaxID=1479524 RepID=UPI002FE1EF95
MKSKVLIGVSGGLFTIVVFSLGFFSSIYLTTSLHSASYTKEHVDNGRFMLYALRHIENGEIEKARLALRGHVSHKVLITDAFRPAINVAATYGNSLKVQWNKESLISSILLSDITNKTLRTDTKTFPSLVFLNEMPQVL